MACARLLILVLERWDNLENVAKLKLYPPKQPLFVYISAINPPLTLVIYYKDMCVLFVYYYV